MLYLEGYCPSLFFIRETLPPKYLISLDTKVFIQETRMSHSLDPYWAWGNARENASCLQLPVMNSGRFDWILRLVNCS